MRTPRLAKDNKAKVVADLAAEEKEMPGVVARGWRIGVQAAHAHPLSLSG